MNVNKTFSGPSQVDWPTELLMSPLMDFINIITSLVAANNKLPYLPKHQTAVFKMEFMGFS